MIIGGMWNILLFIRRELEERYVVHSWTLNAMIQYLLAGVMLFAVIDLNLLNIIIIIK